MLYRFETTVNLTAFFCGLLEAGIRAGSRAMSREGFGRLAESLVSGGFLRRMPSYQECVEQGLQRA